MSTSERVYPHPIFLGDKKISQFVAKQLALQNSLRKSARRCVAPKTGCDEWNQASDESSP
jgi:hypothetical protein